MDDNKSGLNPLLIKTMENEISTRGRALPRFFKFFLSCCILFLASPLQALFVVHSENASAVERQAAKEVKRYIFLRTGTAPDLIKAKAYADLPDGDVIVVAAGDRPIITELKAVYGNVDPPSSDNRMGYIIKSITKDDRNILIITGADTYTTLTAAYRFAEHLGCYFNLVGDTIPDQKIHYPIDISGYDEKAQPWFELRGCIPFHNFTAGPDLWNTADYVSFITQQAKMGLNFFGLHYYNKSGFPGSQEGPEAHLWIGHEDDLNPDGTVKPEGAYKSYWASSFRHGHEPGPIWGEQPIRLSEFTNGTNKLYPYDYFASEAIGSKEPTSPEEMAAVFNSVGKLLNTAFTHAKQLGVKTALGTETPMGATGSIGAERAERNARNLLDFVNKLKKDEEWEGDADDLFLTLFTCPPEVSARMLKEYGFAIPTGRGEVNEAFVKALYEGMFTRIIKTHPLDYFWLWTYECFTYNGGRPSRDQLEAIAEDYRYCSEVMKAMNAPFKMATFGWVLGSQGAPYNNGPIDFHDDLPIDVPFGSLSDNAGGIKAVLDAGREGWSACWYEEDNMLIQPQGRVAGIFNEVAHSLRAGGTQAFLAKHWTINTAAHMSAAHAQLTWDNKVSVSDPMPGIADGVQKFPTFDTFSDDPINENPPRFVDWITQFFQNWAKANFGPERAIEIGSLFATAHQLGEAQKLAKGVKGAFPRVSHRLPSSVMELWPEDGAPTSETDPKFIDAMHLYTEFCSYKDDIVGAGNQDRYMYYYHWFKSQIELGKLALLRMDFLQLVESSDQLAKDALKQKIIKTWSKIMSHEIQRIRNESELAIIAQLQRSTWDNIFRKEFGIEEISLMYSGGKAVRAMPEISQIYANEDFTQKVICIGNGAIADAVMYYRKMGSKGAFAERKLTSIGNNVLKAELPNPGYDFEYYISASVGGETVTYPPEGGSDTHNINKTVIVVRKTIFGEPKPAERVEMTPDIVAEMNQYLKEYYMDWLDQPIDWLDDQTPREASKTEAGKKKVAELIRGMGSPTTYGVEVPRQAMLRELGLSPKVPAVEDQ